MNSEKCKSFSLRRARKTFLEKKRAQQCCAPTRVRRARLGFFFYACFYFSGDVAKYLDDNRIFTEGLERLAKLNLPLVDLEALRRERFGDIRGGYRAKELIVLAGLARESEGNAVEQRRLLLRSFQLRGGLLGERGANTLQRLHVAGSCLDRELARQEKISGIAGLHGDDVTAMAELFDVFLKNDFLHWRFFLFRSKAIRGGP